MAASTNLTAWAGTEGSVSGSIVDTQGISISAAKVELLNSEGQLVKEVTPSATGEFQVFPVQFGDYQISIKADGFAPYRTSVHVSSGGDSHVDARLEPPTLGKEMVLEVKAKRRTTVRNSTAAVSQTEVTHDRIENLPQGDQVSLPQLLATTTPGVVSGPFGQTFIRGNHANVQYQVDGVQLPDSTSGSFGEAFSPRNIDHMEVITGGIPAEYGERMAAVVNIVSKTGAEKPGGSLELNYGTHNKTSPQLIYGGSTPSGDLHYFVSANYNRTDRGLDTPQPYSATNQSQGGSDAVHDESNGNNEFVKVDWQVSNDDKLSFIAFDSRQFYQIPNYPAGFVNGTPYQFGNSGGFLVVPPGTNDSQLENNDYLQVVWKRTFSARSFLQVAPYWKYSYVRVSNDPANDLSPGAGSDSFAENRQANNFGLKTDYTLRAGDRNLVKTGIQLQASQSSGVITVIQPTNTTVDANPDKGYTESLYAQDDYQISKPLTLNAGLRFTATQFNFAGENPTDSLIQPRVGLTYLVNDATKVHAYYGRLFQPAPVENLRDAFVSTGQGNNLVPYDIKAEKDHYFEVGGEHQFGSHQDVSINAYYKIAENMLDDIQLLNTSLASPYNFADGFAYGVELSSSGDITDELSDFVNYSFEVAKGQGISGGLFTQAPGTPTGGGYQYLDHVQVHTVNSGLTYKKNGYWVTLEGLFGSGLRTGNANQFSLPSHFTMDIGGGYEFKSVNWWGRFKLSADVSNIFDDRFPITVANGFNGSHYADGRAFFVRLVKEL